METLLRCTRGIIILIKKWKMLLSFLMVLVITTIFLQSFVTPRRRPKTVLLYNNEHLCSTLDIGSTNELTQYSIVIVVLSCRNNFLQRDLIRQTYGSIGYLNNVRILAVVFMLGDTDASDDQKTDTNLLESERIQFGDIVMGEFVDTYRNLTRKAIMAYEWLVSFCQEADIVVKTDDDVVLNIFKLTEVLGKWTPTEFRPLSFWCGVHWKEAIDRNEKSMYYVSPEQYSGDIIPKHCGGLGYVTIMGMIHRIADEISRSFLGSVCTHEDVFMTGIIPERINSVINETIQFIDKTNDWIVYVSGNNVNEDVQYIWKLLPQTNETVDFQEFRRRSETQIFYLIEHGPEFEKVYRRLWYLIENAFAADI